MCCAGMRLRANHQVLPEAWFFLFVSSHLHPTEKAVAFSQLTCYRVVVGTSQHLYPCPQKEKDGFCHFSVLREGETLSLTTQTKLQGLFIYQR